MTNRLGNDEKSESPPLFWGAPKSLQMVTAGMKLKNKNKNLVPWKKIMTNLDNILKTEILLC